MLLLGVRDLDLVFAGTTQLVDPALGLPVPTPARHEAEVLVVERAQAREQRVDDPRLAVEQGNLMTANVAGDMRRAWHEAGVVETRRVELRRDLWGCGERPHDPSRAYDHAVEPLADRKAPSNQAAGAPSLGA